AATGGPRRGPGGPPRPRPGGVPRRAGRGGALAPGGVRGGGASPAGRVRRPAFLRRRGDVRGERPRRPPRPPPRRGTWPWLDEPRRDVVREREAARGEPYLAARALDEPGTGEVGELRKRRIECAPEAVGERIDVDAGEAAQAPED